jgi:nucleotide sugar dehydrogenase
MSGSNVIGCDINPDVVAAVNSGKSPVIGEAFLQERLAQVHDAGRLTATTNTSEAVSKSDVTVVIVPLMVSDNHEIDYRVMDSATAAVGRGLKKGSLVVYETTLPVGATRQRLGAILEETSGLRMGDDFYLAFSPERIRTGQIFRDLDTYPKVVGGIDAASTEKAKEFYEAVLSAPVMALSSAEAAEFTKLIETTYRDVNIALANEFAVFGARLGLNVHESIAAANSQPQSQVHVPGVGVGGHCIPVYPYFLINHAEPDEMRLPRQARTTNDSMAAYAAALLSSVLGNLAGKKIVILGLAYRANVKESAFSSALRIFDELKREGADVTINDPLFSNEEIVRLGAIPIELDEVDNVDGIVIQAFHKEYASLSPAFFQKAAVIVDGRGDVDPARLGLSATTRYLQVGKAIPAEPAAVEV